jgi:Matrixin
MLKIFRRQIRVSRHAAATLAVIAVSTLVAGFDASPSAQSRAAACDAPIRLKVGTLDPRFEVSPADLQSAIQQAGDLWGAAAHRRLFAYDPNADLAVNLVYDERQEKTQRYVEARQSIREMSEKAARVANDLKPLQAVLKDAEDSYSSQLASFERVREIQLLGGAGKAINDRMASLLKQKQELDRLNAEINTLIEKYDALIESSNAELKAMTDGGIAGIELTAGHYAEEDGTKRIDIFEFKDRTDLLLVLTHELGHALGAGHSRNPQSIMAPLIVTRDLSLGSDDVALLAAAAPCTARP